MKFYDNVLCTCAFQKKKVWTSKMLFRWLCLTSSFSKSDARITKKSCPHNFFLKICFAQNHKRLNFYQKVFLIQGHFKHTGGTKVSNFVKLNIYHFWPLCNIRYVTSAIFHDKKLKILIQNHCLTFFKTQWSIFLTVHQFWPLCKIKKWQFCHFSC